MPAARYRAGYHGRMLAIHKLVPRGAGLAPALLKRAASVELDSAARQNHHLDATDNRVTVYLDGAEQPELTVSTKQHGGTADDFVFPHFAQLKLGWQLYQTDPSPSSYDMHMDDVALSGERVGGCGS